ncbi:MAG: 2-hydroxyacyl-CoA dehydratase family protein [Lachnospiraceae bacterium]|nr:2-hydroxyacyl-CoA dehydratase family protein [Lachnospiraceae bacterium]
MKLNILEKVKNVAKSISEFDVNKLKEADYKKLAKDFVYGKPHGERRLGDLYLPKTGLYKHREWRGLKDTFYYFNMIWLYNYAHMVTDIMKYGGLPAFVRGLWRYRWMGQTYLPVMHWFDRGLEGLRGEALRASAWHYRAMTSETIRQFMRMFAADVSNGGSKELHDHTLAHDETVWGGIFYPWRNNFDDVPLQMIPYFVTCHVNNHTVLHYIDAVQSIGLPGDPCPMCQAEAGIFVDDDMPDYYPAFVTSNEACDGSVATSVLQDWMINKPLFAMPQPMQFDDPLVLEHCEREIEECWKFIEEQTGQPFNFELLKEYLEKQNKLQEFEWEKWDVAANTNYYPINGVAQALYRIYQSQDGYRDIWAETDKKVRKILNKVVEKKIDSFPLTRHRVIAWSCAPLYYSNWCTWAYNCWGLNCIINRDSLMFDMTIRTDTYENCLHDMAVYHEWAPMRRMAVGGMHHIFELWDYMERFHCDMVMMYDQLQCKGMQGVHGLFEDEFRARNIHAIWMPHALPDKRVVSRAEIRQIVNDYMTTVMHEEPLDPSLLDFDDGESW